MSNSNNKNRKIKLNDDEYDNLLKLYQGALDALTQSTLSGGGNSLVGNTYNKHKAWHSVQEYMNELGKKYGYDPEKYVINKNTKELEEYKLR